MNDKRRVAIPALMLALVGVSAQAQKLVSGPATDSSVQSSPIRGAAQAKSIDGSFLASPEFGPDPKGGIGMGLPAGAAVHVALGRSIDSGTLKNGESVPGKLTAPVRTAHGTTIPAGTAVSINVIETVPAGKLSAEGEFSLEVTRVGNLDVETDTKTYRGTPGKRDVADAAPQVGTDAGLPAGAALEFHALRAPEAVNDSPKEAAITPGSVDGIASGGPPPAGSSTNTGEPKFGSTLNNGR